MNIIQGSTFGETWISYLRYLCEYGVENFDDDKKIIESNEVLIQIDKVDKEDPIIDKYADKCLIDAYRKKLFLTSVIPPFNISYGERLFNKNGNNQIKWIIDLLRGKPESKSASISLLHENEVIGKIPCLISITCKIRNNTLMMINVFRSQNVYRSYANFISLHELQCYIADQLNLDCGKLSFMILTPHIYFNDLNIIKLLLGEEGAYEKL